MKVFLNILWHIPFGGFITAIFMALTGLFFCLTIVFIPVGLGFFQISKFLFWPHGNAMVNKADLGLLNEREQSQFWKVWCIINRILYFIPGLCTVISATLLAFGEFISLIGIPCGLVWIKVLGAIFNPCNKICVPESVAMEIDKAKQNNSLRGYDLQQEEAIPSQSPPPSAPVLQEVPVAAAPVLNTTIESVMVNNMEKNPHAGSFIEKEDNRAKGSKNKFALILIVGICLVILAGGIVGYLYLYMPYKRDKDAPRYYTFSNITNLRSSQITGTEFNIIEELPYGMKLITYAFEPEWSDVKLKTGKKEIIGYIASSYILPEDDFFRLNNVFGDNESKECISTAKCRLALLDYLKRNNFNGKIHKTKSFGYGKEWQIYAKPKNVKPNTVSYLRLFDRSSKFTDFAFIIKNNNTGERRLVIYSFTDDEVPVFQYEESAPRSGDIGDIRIGKDRGNIHVIYTDT
ncbi:MAG: hypothetical protein LBV74_11090 [Tannerella sp.]|nr:hypothetical protein [Tannerella sp.]